MLEAHKDGTGGHLWWYSEAEGPELVKGSIPLDLISGCCNSLKSGEPVLGKDGKVIEGVRKQTPGQVPMFDVSTHTGQTHTFRVNTALAQKRLTSRRLEDNQQIDKAIISEQGVWISSIKTAAGVSQRLLREQQTNAAATLHHARQAAGNGASDRGGQGLEQHLAPSVGLFFRQEAMHRLPSRDEQRRSGPVCV